MACATITLACLLTTIASAQQTFDYTAARAHELKPHRHNIPLEGVRPGFNQIRITLTVSPSGDVLKADPSTDPSLLKLWPEIEPEITQWKFTPFAVNGAPVTAQVEEYIDLVPPERPPITHVPRPILRPNSKVSITLQRTQCYGACPAYIVTVSTSGIVFDGGPHVALQGKHTAPIDPAEVRKLAQKFLDADFYSMDPLYHASVTDNPTYFLSISIDGHTKHVEDYVGAWEGMPAIVTDLEDEVDALAETQRWIKAPPPPHS